MHKKQRGFSLMTMVFVGIFAVMALVYAQAFVIIPYTGYKVGTILASLPKDGKEFEIKKVFDERARFERLATIVSSKDLTFTSGEGPTKITAEYEHCSELWKNWTVCAQMTITK